MITILTLTILTAVISGALLFVLVAGVLPGLTALRRENEKLRQAVMAQVVTIDKLRTRKVRV